MGKRINYKQDYKLLRKLYLGLLIISFIILSAGFYLESKNENLKRENNLLKNHISILQEELDEIESRKEFERECFRNGFEISEYHPDFCSGYIINVENIQRKK